MSSSIWKTNCEHNKLNHLFDDVRGGGGGGGVILYDAVGGIRPRRRWIRARTVLSPRTADSEHTKGNNNTPRSHCEHYLPTTGSLSLITDRVLYFYIYSWRINCQRRKGCRTDACDWSTLAAGADNDCRVPRQFYLSFAHYIYIYIEKSL